MDSKLCLALAAVFLLSACGSWFTTPVDTQPPPPAQDKGYGDDDHMTNYWFQKHVTADTAPDPVKSQRILEDDLVACGYEVRDHRRWAAADDPVSNEKGDVVDQHGVNRSDTDLPSTFELSRCMEDKGWVRLKHYYTVPY